MMEVQVVQAAVYQVISVSGVHTFSVYAKAGTADGIRIRIDQTTDANLYVDLTDGSIINQLDNISANVISAGNDWYRVEIAYLASGMINAQIRVVDNGGAATLGNIYIQDAQLEAGLVATDYIETTSSTAQAGILEDMPRLDYSGGASCPALLLEPQRLNLIDNSEYLQGTLWSGAGTTLTANAGTSPEGLDNAYEVEFAASGSAYWYKNGVYVTYSAGASYTWSLYVKSNSQVIKWGGATPSGTDSYSSEDVGDGWYRQIITRTFTSAGTNVLIQPLFDYLNIGRNTPFQVYGAQLEAGSYPTSYIPTYGASVTRSGDSCLATSVSDSIGQEQGTMFFEIDQPYADGVNGAWSISDGSSSNRVTMNTLDVNASTFTLSIAANYAGGSTNVISTNTTYGLHKVAIQYTDTTLKIFVDGAEATSGSTDGFGNYTNFYLGANQVGTGDEIREFKQAVLFPTALTDSECIALTTL